MNGLNYLTPPEIVETSIESGIKKLNMHLLSILVLSFLAGAFIALASEGSNMAAFNLLANPDTYGLGRVLAGAVFGTGLMLVVIAGGELFTGNTMILAGVFDGRVHLSSMLKNWGLVYIGNLAGSLFIVYLISLSGLLGSGSDLLGAVTIKIAVYKVNLSLIEAFVLGILCNWLVCLAVWMAYGAKDIAGKILAVFFPIWLFVTSGFEHCVANMYYIPAGLLAKNEPALVKAAEKLGVTSEALDSLTWGTFFVNNLIPVTLGNIVGGALLVAGVYWFALKKMNKNR